MHHQAMWIPCVETEISTHFGNDDFFGDYFHGVVHLSGLLFDEDHFAKRALA